MVVVLFIDDPDWLPEGTSTENVQSKGRTNVYGCHLPGRSVVVIGVF